MFIQIEGIDGAGKTTQANLLKKWMVAHNMPVTIVKELESTNLGKTIKKMLLQETESTATAEMLLFLASKAQAFSEIIVPTLEKGCSVIADRGNGSFVSYNASLGIKKEMLMFLINTVNRGIIPDITILIDVPVASAKKRMASRIQKTRFDLINDAQMEEQRHHFLSLAENQPNWIIVNGDADRRSISQRIVKEIVERR